MFVARAARTQGKLWVAEGGLRRTLFVHLASARAGGELLATVVATGGVLVALGGLALRAHAIRGWQGRGTGCSARALGGLRRGRASRSLRQQAQIAGRASYRSADQRPQGPRQRARKCSKSHASTGKDGACCLLGPLSDHYTPERLRSGPKPEGRVPASSWSWPVDSPSVPTFVPSGTTRRVRP